ncbi:MAG: GTP-binding protein [Sneathiella sp.]|uniref:CobW family GTP-binding protein n=1 Tax=Sneathiella sp. TaxID=1964365 RepID=UPI003001BB02
MGYRTFRGHFQDTMTTRETPLPLTVLSGFLGAGKTTLVNHLLRHANGQKILVLVNDFGNLPIDRDLIEAENGNLLTLANGCACCSMGGDLFEAFVTALEFDPAPDQLLIEASGVAEPARIANYAKAEPDLRLNAIVTVVDGENFLSSDRDHRVEHVVQEQISSAHLLLLNKCDRINDTRKQNVLKQLKQLNPSTSVIEMVKGQVPTNLVFDIVPISKSSQEVITNPHDHGDIFESWSFQTDQAFRPADLRKILEDLPPSVLRFKGIFQAKPTFEPWTAHKVGSHIEISRHTGSALLPQRTEFVAIGAKGADILTSLNKSFSDGAT